MCSRYFFFLLLLLILCFLLRCFCFFFNWTCSCFFVKNTIPRLYKAETTSWKWCCFCYFFFLTLFWIFFIYFRLVFLCLLPFRSLSIFLAALHHSIAQFIHNFEQHNKDTDCTHQKQFLCIYISFASPVMPSTTRLFLCKWKSWYRFSVFSLVFKYSNIHPYSKYQNTETSNETNNFHFYFLEKWWNEKWADEYFLFLFICIFFFCCFVLNTL